MIYLDHNASSPLRPEAFERIAALYADGATYNASASHSAGRKAKHLLEDARQRILQALDASHYDLYFSASGSEANNWALQALPIQHLAVSAIEHVSILAPAAVQRASHITVTSDGMVNNAHMESLIADYEAPFMVSVMAANNETGAIQPVSVLNDLVASKNGYFHSDITQMIGRIEVSVNELGVDLASFSGHKCGGPVGIGGLLVKKGLNIRPMIHGGSQEKQRRAGTEPVIAAQALATVLELPLPQTSNLQKALERIISDTDSNSIIFSNQVERLPNTTLVSMPDVAAHTQLIYFDTNGFAVSQGAACSSGNVRHSHVLEAMGVDEEIASSTLRISTGWNTKMQDIKAFSEAWKTLHERTHVKNSNFLKEKHNLMLAG